MRENHCSYRVKRVVQGELGVRHVHTLCFMEAKWDPRKERSNVSKHGVDFSEAALALEDEHALTVAFYENDERRYKTLGRSPESGVLLVIHTRIRRRKYSDNQCKARGSNSTASLRKRAISQ